MNYRLTSIIGFSLASTVYTILLAVALPAYAQEVVRQQVVVCLPATMTNSLPSDVFVAAVNQAVRAKKACGAPCRITFVTRESVLGLYAKIILRTYGISDQEVKVSPSGNCDEAHLESEATIEKRVPTLQRCQTALIVLGNRPLNDSTPTVDMVQRVLATVSYAKTLPEPVLILTGGPTVGPVSEAKMMALIALTRGFPRSRLVLEEESWTTGQNAALTARIVERLGVKEVFLVTKKSHLEFALPEFRKYSVFKNVQSLQSPEVYQESIQEMIDYLKFHDDPEVRTRLEALKQHSHGVD